MPGSFSPRANASVFPPPAPLPFFLNGPMDFPVFSFSRGGAAAVATQAGGLTSSLGILQVGVRARFLFACTGNLKLQWGLRNDIHMESHSCSQVML
jgi:hypothetical protein